jgi:hypothetical protein
MTRKIRIMIMTALFIASVAVSAIAADMLKGKVINVTGNKVTVVLEGAVPAWVKTGATAISGSAAPKILSVKGNQVVLRFSKARAAKIKVDSTIILKESSGEDVQGC